jgi:uncharacterized membrane protein YeaQ/YmgE (transglycosylase-associated protein family)
VSAMPAGLRYIAASIINREWRMSFLWTALIGFVVGLLARAILPGTQSLGIILTAVLGIAGAFVARFVGQAVGWYAEGEPAGFLASVVGAIVLLLIVGKLKGKSPS